MNLSKQKWLFIPIGLGLVARIFLLIVSWNNQGYIMGDTVHYVLQAQEIWRGILNPSHYFYTPGFSILLAPVLGATGDLRFVCIIHIFIWLSFTLWVFHILNENGRKRAAIASIWFLSLDPVWMVQTLSMGADFQGAVAFGILFFRMSLRAINGLKEGILAAVATFLKPVYLYVPLILSVLIFKNRRAFSVFLLFWLVPVTAWIGSRGILTGTYSMSGHNAALYGSYMVGYRLMAEGQAAHHEESFRKAGELFEQRRLQNPDLSWRQFILSHVMERPLLFARLFAVSAFKTVFGHTNVLMAKFFTGEDMEGPGLWKMAAGTLGEKIKSISWLWFFGFIFVFIEKMILILFAAQGARRSWRLGDRKSILVAMVLIAYFALSPVVFGDPKYFLPGTLVLLFLI